MKTNKEGVELIKHYEGFRGQAYLCPANVWTVGYGFTRINGIRVKQGDTITLDKAEDELIKQLVEYENGVTKLVEVGVNENQFSSLVSFAFNLGVSALGGSTLLRKLNKGDYIGASNEFGKWVFAGGKKLNGLVKRREDEKQLFLKEV